MLTKKKPCGWNSFLDESKSKFNFILKMMATLPILIYMIANMFCSKEIRIIQFWSCVVRKVKRTKRKTNTEKKNCIRRKDAEERKWRKISCWILAVNKCHYDGYAVHDAVFMFNRRCNSKNCIPKSYNWFQSLS